MIERTLDSQHSHQALAAFLCYKHPSSFWTSFSVVLHSPCGPRPKNPTWKTFSEAVRWIVIGSVLHPSVRPSIHSNQKNSQTRISSPRRQRPATPPPQFVFRACITVQLWREMILLPHANIQSLCESVKITNICFCRRVGWSQLMEGAFEFPKNYLQQPN